MLEEKTAIKISLLYIVGWTLRPKINKVQQNIEMRYNLNDGAS